MRRFTTLTLLTFALATWMVAQTSGGSGAGSAGSGGAHATGSAGAQTGTQTGATQAPMAGTQATGGQNAGAALTAAPNGTSGAANGAIGATTGAIPQAGVPVSNTPGAQPIAPTAAAPANTPAQGQMNGFPNGYSNAGGYATSAPTSAPLISTPSVSMGMASTAPVGASSGTGANQVGATTAPSNTMDTTQSTVIPQAQITNPNYAAINVTGATSAAAEASVNNTPRASLNLGLAPTTYLAPAQTGQSLGDVARLYRNRSHAQRTYTNDDIARIGQQPGANAGAANGNSSSAQTTGGVSGTAIAMPASDQNSAGSSTNQVAAPPMRNEESAPGQAPLPKPPTSKPSPYTPPATPPQR